MRSNADAEDFPTGFRIAGVFFLLLISYMILYQCSVDRERAARNNEARGFFFTTSVRSAPLDFDGVPLAVYGSGTPHRIRVIAC